MPDKHTRPRNSRPTVNYSLHDNPNHITFNIDGGNVWDADDIQTRLPPTVKVSYDGVGYRLEARGQRMSLSQITSIFLRMVSSFGWIRRHVP